MSKSKFPHTLTIIREVNTGSTYKPDVQEKAVLESECKCCLSTNKTAIAEYIITLPLHKVLISKGDTITVTNEVEDIVGDVVVSQINENDAIIYFNRR